jgi:hypothetical protein
MRFSDRFILLYATLGHAVAFLLIEGSGAVHVGFAAWSAVLCSLGVFVIHHLPGRLVWSPVILLACAFVTATLWTLGASLGFATLVIIICPVLGLLNATAFLAEVRRRSANKEGAS